MGIGLGEFLVIFLVAFVIVGPEDLPKVARTLARGVKSARRAAREISGSFEKDLEESGAAKAVKEAGSDVGGAVSEFERVQRQVLMDAGKKAS